ncbi:phosphotransferase enzyme family protein [Brachybacterium tyrofermentans]|uniref:phosphotransferase enzyme family protein n=1 Tax=Brachybacterium tyrofermentans TaxID=47848 RepID=UPI003FD43393
MFTNAELSVHLQQWRTVLGDSPHLGAEQPGRELWPVTAEDGRRYFLKRLGPWRNLPVADQARVLSHLAKSGISVAELLITDEAKLYAGAVDDSFTLLSFIEHDEPHTIDSLDADRLAGGMVASFHEALATYPWSANSYTEHYVESLADELLLPPDILELFHRHRDGIIGRLEPLTPQLVHGDLTPDNVLVHLERETVAFIDFDHLPLAPRVWDMGRYLSRRFRREAPKEALRNTTAFVGSYNCTSPLADTELAAIPAMIATMNVLEASWTTRIISGQLERRLLPAQRAELDPMLDALRWQFNNEDRLEMAIRDELY